MLPEKVRGYLLEDIEATPRLLERLLTGLTDPEIYDRRPDPARFTLREMLAHLADWEPIFQVRFERTKTEDNPTLADIDEGEIAVQKHYDQADPAGCLRRFRTGREANLALLRALTPEEWERPCYRETLGAMTLCDLAVLMSGHDGYHLRQALDWTEASAANISPRRERM